MVAAGSKLGESEVSRVVASVGEVINPLTTSGKILTQGGVLASTYPEWVAAGGIGPSSPGSCLFADATPSHLGSCFSGTLEAVVFTAPSSPIHLRRVERWRFTKDL